jgi:hypothetical protein
VQTRNVPFFLQLGWSRTGEPAEYRGLTHQSMCIRLSGAAADEDSVDLRWALG